MLIPRNLNPLHLYLTDEDRCDEAEQQIECAPLYKAVNFLLIRTLIVAVFFICWHALPESLSGFAVGVNSRGSSTQP